MENLIYTAVGGILLLIGVQVGRTLTEKPTQTNILKFPKLKLVKEEKEIKETPEELKVNKFYD